jgi:hypothetical protein
VKNRSKNKRNTKKTKGSLLIINILKMENRHNNNRIRPTEPVSTKV